MSWPAASAAWLAPILQLHSRASLALCTHLRRSGAHPTQVRRETLFSKFANPAQVRRDHLRTLLRSGTHPCQQVWAPLSADSCSILKTCVHILHNRFMCPSLHICAAKSADSCTILRTCAQHCTFSTADSCTLLCTYARQSQLIYAQFSEHGRIPISWSVHHSQHCTFSTADSCTLLCTCARHCQLTHAQFSKHVRIIISWFTHPSQNMFGPS